MSSTTESSRGQVLAIFAISLTAILLAAALAFDVGDVLLERRDEQNAADASAMAGARYILASEIQARGAARAVARDNGFTHGDGSREVYVNIPPRDPGPWVNFKGAIEVKICNVRPSIFAGIAGILDWPVCARAVAAQLEDVGGPFAILALAPHECGAVTVQGNGGTIYARGNIQVDSDCPDQALKAGGQGVITIDPVDVEAEDACRVFGGIKVTNNATLDCEPISPAPPQGDPLAGLPEPSEVPPNPPIGLALPPDPVGVPTLPAPASCPSTVDSPQTCQFSASYKDTAWVLHPGLYPGGIKLQAGTFYLLPGIYVLGGGGFTSNGNGTNVYSVDTAPSTAEAPTCETWYADGDIGGVLLFNTQLEHAEYRDDAGLYGPIKLNGSDSNVCLRAISDTESIYHNIIIFQDRHFSSGGDDIWINGDDADGLYVRGTVYAAVGDVKVNGNGGNVTLDQVIAYTFFASGDSGLIEALDVNDNVYQFNGAGLVE